MQINAKTEKVPTSTQNISTDICNGFIGGKLNYYIPLLAAEINIFFYDLRSFLRTRAVATSDTTSDGKQASASRSNARSRAPAGQFRSLADNIGSVRLDHSDSTKPPTTLTAHRGNSLRNINVAQLAMSHHYGPTGFFIEVVSSLDYKYMSLYFTRLSPVNF